MNLYIFRFLLFFFVVSGVSAGSAGLIRWTGAEDADGSFEHVLSLLQSKSGFVLGPADFVKVEERDLATSHFAMYTQSIDGLPMNGTSLRIWTDLATQATIQVEAKLENTLLVKNEISRNKKVQADRILSVQDANQIARRAVAKHEDAFPFQLMSTTRAWLGTRMVQIIKAKSRRGDHSLVISVPEGKVLRHEYHRFPEADLPSEAVRVQVYPIYEEFDADTLGQVLPRISTELKNLISEIPQSPNGDLYAPIRAQHYWSDHEDPVLAATPEGRAAGFWSMDGIQAWADALKAALPLGPNNYAGGGVILEGKYVTVNIHPDAPSAFPNIQIPLKPSLELYPHWQNALNGDQLGSEMIPTSFLLGKKIISAEDAWSRPAHRLPDHDPATYINDGFDEIQVYYAVDRFMESLRGMGFTDPELSLRPFRAFLYDPDISMRNNAYYTNDTINFTTYSPHEPNYARSNSTIWHELGHGIMDRLMGPHIVLADTGGLSEGMADFLAALIVADTMRDEIYPGMHAYRILNRTGFHLTNEVHDDGEAYGGAMNDLKTAALAHFGRAGLLKVTDLTLEAMRLTRNHPGLTAADWFEHMLFADSRGSAVRTPGELREFILNALNGRNFSLDPAVRLASFSMQVDGQEITSGSSGARENPRQISLLPTEQAHFNLTVKLTDGDYYHFQYPVTVKVFYRSGALQGALHWAGEEAEPQTVVIASEADLVQIPLSISGQCDAINRPGGRCVDYAYVQIWNQDPAATKPVAKKRFYLALTPQQPAP